MVAKRDPFRAKRLVECLPGPLAKEARERYGYGKDNMSVRDADVLQFIDERANEVALGAEKAKRKAIAYSKAWSKINNYKRPATKSEKKNDDLLDIIDDDGNILDPASGLRAFLHTDRRELWRGGHLEGKIRAIQAEAHYRLNDMITRLNPEYLGFKRHTKVQRDFVRAMYGDDTLSPKFKQWGTDWRTLNTELIQRYNNSVTEDMHLDFDDMALPIQTSPMKINENYGQFNEFMDFVRPLLDMEAMGLTPQNIQARMRKFYDDVRTEGMASRTVDQEHDNPFAKRFKEQRFLKFKDAESHIKYIEELSDTRPYASIMDHVTLISREIALKEELGPAPSATFKDLRNSVVETTGRKQDGASAQKRFDNIAGALTPVSNRMSDNFQNARNTISAIKLVGSTLSAIGDVGFGAFTSFYNGISASGSFKRAMSNILTFTGEGRKANMRNASRVGFLLDHAIDQLDINSRLGDIFGRNRFARMAEFTMRGSGLTHWTVSQKAAFHMEFMFELGRWQPENKGLTRAFKRYGISEAEAKFIAEKAPRVDVGGDSYVDPFALPADLKERVMIMVSSETKYAVPEPDAAVQAVMNQGTRRGTVEGEILRSAGQFKAFPVSIAWSHLARIANGFEGDVASRAAYGAGLITTATMFGALSVQVKEIAKGRKPRDMNGGFWLDAMIAGGALSIAGDLVLNDPDAFGQSAADFFAGPLFGEMDRIILKGLVGGTHDVLTADRELQELEQQLRATGRKAFNYVPGQFWYVRLAMDRLFLDAAKKSIDPEHARAQAARELKRRRDGEQNERWWK